MGHVRSKLREMAPLKISRDRKSAQSEDDSSSESKCTVIPKNVQVIGMTLEGMGNKREVVIRVNSNAKNRVFNLSVPDLAVGDRKALASVLAEADSYDFLDVKSLKRIAIAILKKAVSEDVIVLCTQGLHELEINGEAYQVYVWGNEACCMGSDVPKKIVVSNKNPPRSPSCDLATWKGNVASELKGNHYLTAVHAHALASAIRRIFRQPRLSLSLVGPTTVGKSVTEKSAQSMIGHVDDVKSMSGTKVGLLEYLHARPDSPVFFQDIRQNDSPNIFIDIVFDLAEGAERMRSGQKQENELAATMILSNERLAADMVGGRKYSIDEGLYSRLFEIKCNGEYGAFHHLHGCESAAEFAQELERNSTKYYGAAWPSWIRALSRNWPKVLRSYETELPRVKAEIAAQAGEAAHGRVNNRVLDALSFSAWSGVIASRAGILPLNKHEIIDAFGLVLREHISRQISGSTPLADQLISEVRGCLDENSSRFPDLRAFNDEKQSAVYGYRGKSTRHGELFLFLPNVFTRLFQGKYGSVAYKILADAGFLVTTSGRGHQYQVRVPGLEERKSFIAVTANIRFD
jgi:hypothetical protein